MCSYLHLPAHLQAAVSYQGNRRWETLGLVPFPSQSPTPQTLPCQVTWCGEVSCHPMGVESHLIPSHQGCLQADLCSLLISIPQWNKAIAPFTLCLQQTKTRDRMGYTWMLEVGLAIAWWWLKWKCLALSCFISTPKHQYPPKQNWQN